MCRDAGSGEEICHLDRPAPQDARCQEFFNTTLPTYPEEYEEIQLVSENGTESVFCFSSASPRKQSRGWCETNETYYGFGMEAEAGWGFCGPDCFLGAIRKEVEGSILRQVAGVDILPADACDDFLKTTVGPAGVQAVFRTRIWILFLRNALYPLLKWVKINFVNVAQIPVIELFVHAQIVYVEHVSVKNLPRK
jgi:hypothetical protein